MPVRVEKTLPKAAEDFGRVVSGWCLAISGDGAAGGTPPARSLAGDWWCHPTARSVSCHPAETPSKRAVAIRDRICIYYEGCHYPGCVVAPLVLRDVSVAAPKR